MMEPNTHEVGTPVYAQETFFLHTKNASGALELLLYMIPPTFIHGVPLNPKVPTGPEWRPRDDRWGG